MEFGAYRRLKIVIKFIVGKKHFQSFCQSQMKTAQLLIQLVCHNEALGWRLNHMNVFIL